MLTGFIVWYAGATLFAVLLGKSDGSYMADKLLETRAGFASVVGAIIFWPVILVAMILILPYMWGANK